MLSDLTDEQLEMLVELTESRLCRISKDDLRLHEFQVLWTKELEDEVRTYWDLLNDNWKAYRASDSLPPCTCHVHENGFLAREQFNPYFYSGEPCSIEWFNLNKEKVK